MFVKMKSLSNFRSLIIFLCCYSVSAFACFDRGDTVRKYLQLGNLEDGHYYQIDYVNNASASFDVCFCPTFGFGGCFGDIEFANVDPKNAAAYPMILGKGCPNYTNTASGQSFYHSPFDPSDSQQVVLDIVIPNNAPYSANANIKVNLYDITNGSPVFVRSSSSAVFSTCAAPGTAPSQPTAVHFFPSQSSFSGCGWKFSTNSVSGATQYVWRINNRPAQSYSSHTTGPTLPITSSGVHNVCVSASNSFGTSPQFCRNVTLSSLSCY